MVQAMRRWFGRTDAAAQRAISRIEQLAQLKPGWNSYKAAPISGYAMKKAIGLVYAMDSVGAVPEMKIAPTSDGGVFLGWSAPSALGDLDVEFIFLADRSEFLIGLPEADDFIARGSAEDFHAALKKVDEILTQHAPA